MFNYLFYSALIIFLLGLVYKISKWFTTKFGDAGQDFSALQRVTSAAKGIARIVFSSKLLLVLNALLVDVLLQARVFKEDGLRWLAHMLIFYGFMLLLLMHALDSEFTAVLFTDYYATVNPFFFLRDLFGAMVLAGVGMAVFRRYLSKPRRLRTGPRDHYAIIILSVIMLSGIGLIGLKITSYGEFTIMVEDYAGLDDEEEIQALEAVWVKDFGVVSPNIKAPFDEDLLSAGREVHESSCLDCHASAQMEANSSLKICLLKTLWHISFFDVGRQAESLLKRSRVHGSTPLMNLLSRWPVLMGRLFDVIQLGGSCQPLRVRAR